MRSLIILFLIPLCSFMLNTDKLNKCNGFEHYVFGASMESFRNLTFEIQEGNSKLYIADPKSIIIEGVQFEHIHLTFIKNRLSAIALSTTNASSGAFLAFLKNNYGAPAKINRNYEWLGKKARIVFEPYQRSKDAAIDFYSRENEGTKL